MIDAEALHEAEQQALGQAAQLDLSLMSRLHRLAMEAEEPAEINGYVRSYCRVSRAMRQAIMVRARLRLEREKHLAALTAKPAPGASVSRYEPFPGDPDFDPSQLDPDELRIEARTLDLQEAAARIVAAAHPDMPRAEREDALDRIDGWIDLEIERAEVRGRAFGEQPLDDHVLELCDAADLPQDVGRRFRTLPRAPRDAELDPDNEWPSLAGGAHIFDDEADDPPRRETG